MTVPVAEARTILVAGCGGIGAIYAARLASVAQVAVYDTNAAHVAAIRRDGLTISGVTQMRAEVEAHAGADALRGRHFDAVLVMVKSMYTEELIRTLASRLDGRPLLVTVQNGQGNVEVLSDHCDWDIAYGMTWEAGEYMRPGEVRHTVHGPPACIGPARGSLERCAWLGALLERAGLPTRVVEDPRSAIWSKFVFNAAMNPVSALLGGIPQAKYASDDTYRVLRALVAEGSEVARKLGITLDHDPLQLIEEVRRGEKAMPSHPGSMTQDLRRGTPTEIDALTGYIVRKGRELGIPTPLHETIYHLLKGLEYGLRAQREATPPAATASDLHRAL